MKDIKKLLCENMYEFVKEHINEVEEKRAIFGRSQTFQSLGFKNAEDMLEQIKNDWDVAYWALTELLSWALLQNYTREFFTEEEADDDTPTVYKLDDKGCKRYFICTSELTEPTEIKEVRKVTKLVEINTWE